MTAWWRRLATVLMAGLFMVVLTAGGASADTMIDDPCLHNPSSSCIPTPASQSNLLPVNRWVDATGSLHGRLSSSVIDDIAEKIQRNGTYPVLMSLGNSMWSGATGMTSAAIRMDILDSAGATADAAAAKIGSSLMSSGVLVLLAVIALIIPLWKAGRGRGAAPWAAFGKVAATVALFSVMVAGAGASTTSADGRFEPGRFSPGWFVVTTNTVLSTLASAPAAALVMSESGAGFTYDDSAKGDLSCFQYINTMKADYATVSAVDTMEGSIPLVMSSMWEATGMEVWATAQFGAENPYGDFSFCRLLEQTSGTSTAYQYALTLRATDDPIADVANIQSLAWQTADNNQEDRTMIAWGQCRPDGSGGWELATGWAANKNVDGRGAADAINDCREWWSNPANDATDVNGNPPAGRFDDGASAFNWAGSSEIINDTGTDQVRNYLLTLQGHTGGGVTSSMAMVYTYVFSSLIMLVIFGMISAGIIIAKVGALVMMVATFFALLISLWPGNSRTGALGKFFGQYVGMALFVFGIQLIFAFLTLITSMMVAAGNEMFGGGSMISMIWTGFSPVVAVVVLHQVFTKFLKVPSPFSMTGAQQWGAAAGGGAVGGAVGAGLMQRVNRMKARGESAVMRSGARAGSRALGVVSGGKFGRGGRPGRAGAIAGGAPGAGAAVGAPGGAKAGRGGGRKTWDSAGTGAAVGANVGVRGAATTSPGRAGTFRNKGTEFVSGARDFETRAERKEVRDADRKAAEERGYSGGRMGRYNEGLTKRWADLGDKFRTRPIRQNLAASAKTTAKVAAKVAGGAALIVGTAGFAAPVMATVWGKGHLGRVRDARSASVMEFESQQAAAQLAAQQAAAQGDPSVDSGARRNHEPVIPVLTVTHFPAARTPVATVRRVAGGGTRSAGPAARTPVAPSVRRVAGGGNAKPFRR